MNTRKFSKAQEKQVAKKVNGRRTANSGATMFQKGDVYSDSFCIECKTATTEKQSMSIKKEWIDKLKEEAFASNKPNWALAFNFGDPLRNTENFYIISEDTFIKLQKLLEEDN